MTDGMALSSLHTGFVPGQDLPSLPHPLTSSLRGPAAPRVPPHHGEVSILTGSWTVAVLAGAPCVQRAANPTVRAEQDVPSLLCPALPSQSARGSSCTKQVATPAIRGFILGENKARTPQTRVSPGPGGAHGCSREGIGYLMSPYVA